MPADMPQTPPLPSPLDRAEDALGRAQQILSAGGGLDATLAQMVSAYAVRDRQVQALAQIIAQAGEHVAAARAQAQPSPVEDAAPSAPKSDGAAQNTAG